MNRVIVLIIIRLDIIMFKWLYNNHCENKKNTGDNLACRRNASVFMAERILDGRGWRTCMSMKHVHRPMIWSSEIPLARARTADIIMTNENAVLRNYPGFLITRPARVQSCDGTTREWLPKLSDVRPVNIIFYTNHIQSISLALIITSTIMQAGTHLYSTHVKILCVRV